MPVTVDWRQFGTVAAAAGSTFESSDNHNMLGLIVVCRQATPCTRTSAAAGLQLCSAHGTTYRDVALHVQQKYPYACASMHTYVPLHNACTHKMHDTSTRMAIGISPTPQRLKTRSFHSCLKQRMGREAAELRKAGGQVPWASDAATGLPT